MSELSLRDHNIVLRKMKWCKMMSYGNRINTQRNSLLAQAEQQGLKDLCGEIFTGCLMNDKESPESIPCNA